MATRALNARTIPDRYPVRHIHYSHQLAGCTIFSTTDLVGAYRIPLHPDDVQKTAITTPGFEFPFMSYSLRNTAQTFQRFIDEIARGFDFASPA